MLKKILNCAKVYGIILSHYGGLPLWKRNIAMQITSTKENEKLTVFISGRVDTTTAPDVDDYINANAQGITELTLDIKDMSYISSAGLRVLLKTQKMMNKQGSMKVVNAQSDVMEIFDMTGFSDILTLE